MKNTFLLVKEKEDKEQATEPVLKKFIVSDITPERLITIHQDNKRGICLYVDELMSWLKNFNRYNSGSEEQFWLSVFSGKPIILDRQGNKNSAFIKHSFISVIGTIQKGLLNHHALPHAHQPLPIFPSSVSTSCSLQICANQSAPSRPTAETISFARNSSPFSVRTPTALPVLNDEVFDHSIKTDFHACF